MAKVLVTGATGFVGRYVVKELIKRGYTLRCIVRPTSTKIDFLKNLGVEIYLANLIQYESLEPAFDEVEYVIHLAGIIQPYGTNTFYRVHVEVTRNVVDFARQAGVKKFVHMSALGTSKTARSLYHKTKFLAERYVINSGLCYTIFRPSVIFGERAGFIKLILGLLERPLFIPIPGSGKFKIQPVWVEDVARLFVDSLQNKSSDNKIFEIGGPDVYEFQQVIDIIAETLNKKKPKIHIPLWMLMIIAFFMEQIMPVPEFTREQITMLKDDNICDILPLINTFNIQPKKFDIWVKETFSIR